jgi:hypothetical protein
MDPETGPGVGGNAPRPRLEAGGAGVTWQGY